MFNIYLFISFVAKATFLVALEFWNSKDEVIAPNLDGYSSERTVQLWINDIKDIRLF